METDMTPDEIKQMLADREAGTKGPWWWRGETADYPESLCPVFRAEMSQGFGYIDWHDRSSMPANARRIARVPALEDHIIAQEAAIAAKDAEIERLRGALQPFAAAWIVAQQSGQTAMSRLALIARDETAGVHFMRARAALNGDRNDD